MANPNDPEDAVTKVTPLAPVDYVLEQLGLPRIDPFLRMVAPQNVLSNMMGVPTPCDFAEAMMERMHRDARSQRFQPPQIPRLPGLGDLPRPPFPY